MTIEELDLSVRSFNCLKRAGINTVEDLISRTEDDMMKVKPRQKVPRRGHQQADSFTISKEEV